MHGKNSQFSNQKVPLWANYQLTEVSTGRITSAVSFGGALVLCIKPTSSLPVLQIPFLHYEISYG